MNKNVLGILGVLLAVAVGYGLNYHFDDLLIWLGGDTSFVPDKPEVVGPFGPYN